MRPSFVVLAAACDQNGERSKLPEAPRARLPKPKRRRSRRAILPRTEERAERWEERGMIEASKSHRAMTCSAKLILRRAHDQMRQEAQRAFEISRGEGKVTRAELAL